MSYKITYQENKKLKTVVSEDLNILPNNIIKIEEKNRFKWSGLKQNYQKETLELFEQLNIMLNANLTLSEAVALSLITQQSDFSKKVLLTIQDSITQGKPIEKSLQKYQKYIGDLAILFLKLGIQNGNIKQSINSLVTILQGDIQTQTKLQDSLRYPKLLIVTLCIAIAMVFIYLVPNFEYTFSNLQAEIPLATKMLFSFHHIIVDHPYTIIGVVLAVFCLGYFIFIKWRYFFHKQLVLSFPIVRNVLRDYYFYRLFLLMSVIVDSKYQFQVAIENSKNLIPNLYIHKGIEKIITNIKNGVPISQSFQKTGLFDSLTIKLLFTAEQTTRYDTILADIASYYDLRFQKSLKLFTAYIEPAIVLLIALLVLWLMIAIMIPIWDMGSFLG